MNLPRICAVMFWVIACQGAGWPAQDYRIFSRDLPDAYAPGASTTVTLVYRIRDFGSFFGDVYETIPAGWSTVHSDPPLTVFDEAAGTIHWRLDMGMVIWELRIVYEVVPPLTQRGPVSFDGECWYSISPNGPRVYEATIGETTMSERVGSIRYRPHWATVQETIDASEWGDTVMVSGADTPFVGNVAMKPGVNLAGFVDWPTYQPPVLEPENPDDPTIIAAPYADISGFIIRSGATGIRVSDPTVAISDCVISGTQEAAIEYLGVTEGSAVNCTIADNSGAGVRADAPSPDIAVTNSILFGNGDKDIENCTARYCLLEDEIEDGWGENNLPGDPMFVSAAAGDYRLLRSSPCIDAGDNGAVEADETDVLGKPRIMFGGKSETVDMGAYEYWFISASPRPHSSDIEVSWASESGRAYSVFRSADLATWQLANDSVLASGNMTVWLDPIGSLTATPIRFYRVMENE